MSLKYEPVSVEIESCTDLVQLSIPEVANPLQLGNGMGWRISSLNKPNQRINQHDRMLPIQASLAISGYQKQTLPPDYLFPKVCDSWCKLCEQFPVHF